MKSFRDKDSVSEQLDFMRMLNPFEQTRWLVEKIFELTKKIETLEEVVTDDKPKSRWK